MAAKVAFPRICIALGLTDPVQLLEGAVREAEAGESFLEIRLDYLAYPEKGLEIIRTLLDRYSGCSILATCRRHQNRGRFNGSIDQQLRILEGAIKAGAQAVDVEVESAELAPQPLAG